MMALFFLSKKTCMWRDGTLKRPSNPFNNVSFTNLFHSVPAKAGVGTSNVDVENKSQTVM